MRLIIQPDYQSVSQWAAHYVAAKIKAANPTPEKGIATFTLFLFSQHVVNDYVILN